MEKKMKKELASAISDNVSNLQSKVDDRQSMMEFNDNVS